MVLAVGAIALCIIGILLYIILTKQEREIGFLQGELLYVDLKNRNTKILKATSLPLVGKPDSIIRQNGELIPVEVKTGRTPKAPYLNHTMQLMAYCFLIEEHFKKRPPGGYLQYPEKKFMISYTPEAQESVRTLVAEILMNKRGKKVFTCSHPEHNS